ncbi:exodeoxyribonuclease III [Halioxenophilus sp. WMMB6]|uniref:exodeoxyribonuclease III n=1 Tax=Halioxenophilus sp. WMMB6 TaxID=3073815 RepID=UPI00295EAE12|nr:exodeoxyribonuclease III [Halioxenophilus sp. WMMB6]
MKVVSFNVNSIRARLHQLEAVIERHSPDFIGLQETKVTDAEFPQAEIEQLGYNTYFHGQKTHYGVALLSKSPANHLQKGFNSDTEESQRRFILGEFDSECGPLTIINGYFPQGENQAHETKYPNKRHFYQELTALLQSRYKPDQALLVIGDMNISPTDLDIGIGEDNRKRWLRTGKCSFLPEEREWLAKLLDWGLVDTFRCRYPSEDQTYSWFDYRSKGFEREPKRGLRIDLILASKGLCQRMDDSGIDYHIRAMEKSSDHCPVWTSFTS